MKNVISLLLYLMLIDLFFSNFSLCILFSSSSSETMSRHYRNTTDKIIFLVFPSFRLRDSRSLKSPTFFPGLFDFSGTFLNDLTEKLKNLPNKEISQNSAVTKNTIDNEKNNNSDQSAYNCNISDIKNDTLSIGIIEKKLIQTDKRSTTVNSTNISSSSSSGSSSSSSSNFFSMIPIDDVSFLISLTSQL